MKTPAELDSLDELLIGFALKAYPLMNKDQFFDKNGKPQQGATILKQCSAAINRHIAEAVRLELETLNDVTTIVEDRFMRDDKYYFERGYALVQRLAALQKQGGEG